MFASRQGAQFTNKKDPGTYCETCKLDCKTQNAFNKHITSTMHKLNMQKRGAAPAAPAAVMSKPAAVPRIVPNQRGAAVQAPVETKPEGMEVDDDEESEEEGEPVTFCDVCNIDCKTEAGFDTHCAGMAHMMKAQNISGQNRDQTAIKQEMEISRVNNKEGAAGKTKKEAGEPEQEKPVQKRTLAEIERLAKPGESIYCRVCGTWSTHGDSWEGHKKSKIHIRRAFVKKKGGLRALTDGMRYVKMGEPPHCLGDLMKADPPLCGVDYIVEVRRSNPLKDPYFACMLCLNSCIDIPTMIRHIRGGEHKKNFLKNHIRDLADDFGYLFPKGEHEDWFAHHFLRDEEVDPPPGHREYKDPPVQFVRETCNNILHAFYEKFGMQQMQVIQESVGQKPKTWFGKDEIRLRPATPPRQKKIADGDNTPHIKGDIVWHAKRLYVGNTPTKCDKDDMKEFLSKQLQDLGLVQGDDSIIKKIEIDDAKGFGWVNFQTLNGATACLELDGISYQGYYLKFRRPAKYNEDLFASDAAAFLASIKGAGATAAAAAPAQTEAAKPILGAKRQIPAGQNAGKKGRFEQSAIAQGWSQADYDYYQAEGAPNQSYGEYSYFSGIGGKQKNTYSGLDGRYGGQEPDPPQLARSGQKPQASRQSLQRPVPSKPAAPAQPAEPPKPKAAPHFMSSVFRKATQILEQNSICSDGERRMAVQVSNLLRNKIAAFHNEETDGDIPILKIPEKTGLMDWLRFLVKALDKGIIKSDGECKLGTGLLDLLTARMAVYQSGGATAAPAPAAPAPVAAPLPKAQPPASAPAPPLPQAQGPQPVYTTNPARSLPAKAAASYPAAGSYGAANNSIGQYSTYGQGGYATNYSVGSLSTSYSTAIPGGYTGAGANAASYPAQPTQAYQYQQQAYYNGQGYGYGYN